MQLLLSPPNAGSVTQFHLKICGKEKHGNYEKKMWYQCIPLNQDILWKAPNIDSIYLCCINNLYNKAEARGGGGEGRLVEAIIISEKNQHDSAVYIKEAPRSSEKWEKYLRVATCAAFCSALQMITNYSCRGKIAKFSRMRKIAQFTRTGKSRKSAKICVNSIWMDLVPPANSKAKLLLVFRTTWGSCRAVP